MHPMLRKVYMKIAITGSHGFLGTALIEELKAKGHEVIAIVRSSNNVDDILWDINKQSIDAQKLDDAKVDVVVHLAGEGIAEKKWSDNEKKEILESRVLGTKLLVKTLSELKNKPKILISGSAIGYYGSRGDELLDEASSPNTDFLSDVCVKWEAEALAVKDTGIKLAFIRTGIVLGKTGGTLKKMILPFKLGAGGRIGNGNQMMSWITLSDWVRSVIFIAENNLEGPFNIVAPCPVTNKQFTKALGAAVHRPTFLPTPLLPLKALYGSELVETLLLGSQNVVPKALIEAGFQFEHENIASALKSILE